jgi:ATP-dependent Zn protease
VTWAETLRLAAADPTTWRDLRGTAFHEAGHAVAGLAVSARVRALHLDVKVALEGSEIASIGGRARFDHRRPGYDSDLIDAAGFVAEAVATRGQLPLSGSDSDFQRILGRVRLTPEARSVAPAEAIQGARRILCRRWAEVTAVAEALLLRSTLEGRAVESIVHRAACPRPAA